MYDNQETEVEKRVPRFIQFLMNVSEAVAQKAEEEEVGEVSAEVVQLREQTESAKGLACVQLRFVNHDGDASEFMLFAAGQYRDKSLVKIERVGEEESVLVSSNPSLILSYISY